MSSPKQVCLNIYSSSIFHKLMVPPNGDRFASSHFVHMTPDVTKIGLSGDQQSQGMPISVIVEPSTIPREQLAQIPQPHIWWFLAPLQNETTRNHIKGSAIGKFSARWLSDYTRPLEDRGLAQRPLVIVSDVTSQDTVTKAGFEAIVSPPAVADVLFREPMSGGPGGKFFIPTAPNEYQEMFLSQLDLPEERVDALQAPAQLEESASEVHGFGVSIGRSPLREFPVLAAAHLAVANCLISEPLFPLHGLEPGIDYFEITSPEELFHLTQYLDRNPDASRMMAYRGRRKADYFLASRVWANIIEELQLYLLG